MKFYAKGPFQVCIAKGAGNVPDVDPIDVLYDVSSHLF